MPKTLAFSHSGVTETRLSLLLKTTKKLSKIYETMIFRYWTSSSTGQWPQDRGDKQMNPMILPPCCLEKVCRPQKQGGEIQAVPGKFHKVTSQS